MPDLAQQIRERLDGIARGTEAESPPPFVQITFPNEATAEQIEQWQAHWDELLADARSQRLRILPPSPKFYPGFEQMRDAILAAVDDHGPDPGADGDCRRCVDWDEDEEGYLAAYRVGNCPTLVRIAKALGIEVSGG